MKTIHIFALIATSVVLNYSMPLRASETDNRIEASFNKSYANKVILKDDAIKAQSRNGVVTLTGQVSEYNHWRLAQETLTDIPGVQSVDNQLVIKLEGNEESDSWIKAKVRSVLALHRRVSGSGTQVDIKEGVITLRGTATSEAQRDLSTEYAADVKGVLRVTNVMTITTPPSKADEKACELMDDASITANVKVALLSHHSTSSVKTKLATTDGIITVSGIAKNTAEKVLVTKLATDIIGVKSVVNNMTVER